MRKFFRHWRLGLRVEGYPPQNQKEGRFFNYCRIPSLPLNQLIESIDGHLKVSTIIRNKNGKVIAKLTRNEWEVSPQKSEAWDLNYTDDALEVIDAHDYVVLQVRVLPDRIQLQGEWWDEKGKGMRLIQSRSYPPGPGGLIAFLPLSPKVLFLPQIERIFEYPSKTHLGKMRTPYIILSSCPPPFATSNQSK